MFLIRGIVFTHEAVRDWEAKLAPLIAEGLRKRRAGKAGRRWHVDVDAVGEINNWGQGTRNLSRNGIFHPPRPSEASFRISPTASPVDEDTDPDLIGIAGEDGQRWARAPSRSSKGSKIETPSRRRAAGPSVGANPANHCLPAS